MDLGSGIWDPGSEIRDPEKTYSGSRIQGSKRHRSRIRIRNTDYVACKFPQFFYNAPTQYRYLETIIVCK
jgi:hypothetical protein